MAIRVVWTGPLLEVECSGSDCIRPGVEGLRWGEIHSQHEEYSHTKMSKQHKIRSGWNVRCHMETRAFVDPPGSCRWEKGSLLVQLLHSAIPLLYSDDFLVTFIPKWTQNPSISRQSSLWPTECWGSGGDWSISLGSWRKIGDGGSKKPSQADQLAFHSPCRSPHCWQNQSHMKADFDIDKATFSSTSSPAIVEWISSVLFRCWNGPILLGCEKVELRNSPRTLNFNLIHM